ncbi:MAG TPA: universal stress protein [Verrucomicrobiae bacterium]|nr:universal stress protein [Verrucomicrobiae bacterium]
MKLLICSDASDQADRAVRLGATLAAACKAEVVLLGIIEAKGHSDALLDSLRRGQALLQDKGVSAELVTKMGNPIEEIVRRTTEAAFDLVVIGAVRKEPRGLFWLSSKAYKIVKEVQPPVLIVSGKATALKKILICSGGKSYIEPALRLTGKIAQGAGAQITLLHVLPEPPAIYARLPRMQETVDWLLNSNTELGLNLRRAKESLEQLGVSTDLKLRRGAVLEEILSEIRESGYDLVVTGSALSRGLRTYVLGDVSREVVNRASCPVMVVRSREAPSDAPSGIRGLFERLAPPRGSTERRRQRGPGAAEKRLGCGALQPMPRFRGSA